MNRRESFWPYLRHSAGTLLGALSVLATLIILAGVVPCALAFIVPVPYGLVLAVVWLVVVMIVGSAFLDWMTD